MVIKQENIFNEEIRKYSDRQYDGVKISSFMEAVFPSRWSRNTGPPTIEFISMPGFKEAKPYFAEYYSWRKGYQFAAHNIRLRLFKNAEVLLVEIQSQLNN